MDKEGKKPIVQKKPVMKAAAQEYEDIFGNAMKLTPELQKELDEKGLIPRFGDYKQLKADDGYHNRGWQIYRKDKNSTSSDFSFSPDGLVRRGSCVLMVKSKDAHRKHKAYLKNRAQNYGKQFRAKTADEMRQKVKGSRLGSQIVDGYEWEE